MRCPDCSKMVSMEFGDPYLVQELNLDGASVTCTVRIVRTCAECSTELKEAYLELEDELSPDVLKDHEGEGHEVEIEENGIEPIEESGTRYAKSFFGAEVSYTLTCTCDKDQKEGRWSYEGTLFDKIAASHMDEMV